MKKKPAIIGIVVLVLGIGAWFAYDTLSGSVEQTVRDNSHLTKPEEIESAEAPGLKIASIEPLSGEFASDPDSSELYFVNGAEGNPLGYFKTFSVSITGDGTPEGMSIEATIDPKSAFTNNSMRDDHIQGEDFFNTGNFPEIKFVSEKVELGEKGYQATGKMTFLGVEQTIVIPFKYSGSGTTSEGRIYHVLEGDLVFDTSAHNVVSGQVSETVSASFYIQVQEKKG